MSLQTKIEQYVQVPNSVLESLLIVATLNPYSEKALKAINTVNNIHGVS